jgi:hypothetical protein
LLWGEPGRPAADFLEFAGLEFPGGSLNRLRTVLRAKTVPQGLKPDSSSSDYGTAEQLGEEGAL